MQSQHNGHRRDLTGDEELHEAARSGQHPQRPVDQPEERAATSGETIQEETTSPDEPPDDAQHWLERWRLEHELDGE